MSAKLKIDELFERAKESQKQMTFVGASTNRMFDVFVKKAIMSRINSSRAIAAHLKMSEEMLMENLNADLFSVCDTGNGNVMIGLTPAALSM
ncbi:hypothetical protein JCM19237_252 [Photobacterium aphoticum]|uniref:Uncharacterized protein n=1 Tax=Photobacterium aphoticum TaxID=754436 RepID=A0A090RK41_9GAMM|nr:hypothetical protein JCM19237_252 [Photobacterium aphoticum]